MRGFFCAQAGVAVHCRQTLEGAEGYPLLESYRPLPDYWVTLLFSRLMGTRVLAAASDNPNVRVYARPSPPCFLRLAHSLVA